MIEIPNLEPTYGQHELEQLQERYNRLLFLDPPNTNSSEPVSSANTIQLSESEALAPLHLQTGSSIHSEQPGTESPLVSLPQLVHTTESPIASDLYFLAQHVGDSDPNLPANLLTLHLESAALIHEANNSYEQSIVESVSTGPHVNKADSALAPAYDPAFMISVQPTLNHQSSNVLLALSDYARELDIEPQVVEYSMAHAVHLTLPSKGHPLRRAIAASPDIDAEVQMESFSDFEGFDEFEADKPLHLAQPFVSPTSHTEPSPQLPPPLSAKSLRLAFTHGEEFTQMRRVLATELKTPAEYTLHIVFTQFVRHAERKLNLCLDYPLLEEPPIIELLAEGVDLHFDNIVSSLGYIAKRKPKPVIDSVMFWRKSKSEVAAMAAAEVEKIFAAAKSNLSRVATAGQTAGLGVSMGALSSGFNSALNSATSVYSGSQQILPLPQPKAKRSISLMRTKSLSKLAHRREMSTSAVQNSDLRSSHSRTSMEQPESVEYTRQKHLYDEQISQARETAIQAERKSLASIYILCRVLIEVVKQTSFDTMGDDLGGKLEEIVYTQLKTSDPVSTSESFVRLANWNLFAELLGFMSEKRFLSVSDRFIADLEKVPVQVKHEDEPRLHLLIHGMRYLKLTNYPLEKFEESAEFIQSMTKFFEKTQNQTILFAYAEVLSNLMLPLASILTAEANHPLWVEAITKIYKKASRLWISTTSTSHPGGSPMVTSAPNVNGPSMSSTGNSTALILMTSALSVSSKELFSDNWYNILEANANKLKPKGDTEDKTKLMICASRLLWVYVNRLPDTLNNTIKKLDSFFDLLFFGPNVSGKKQQWIVLDMHLINALSEVIRIVGFQHFNYVLDNVILRLLRSSFNGVSLENLSPEKLILVIKSYMMCLRDYKLGEKPVFPTDAVISEALLELIGPTESQRRSFRSGIDPRHDLLFQKWNKLMFDSRNIKNYASHEDICRTFATLLKLLDGQCGMSSWSQNGSALSTQTYTKSLSTFSNFHFGIDFNMQSAKDVNIELFVTLIDACAWSIVPLTNDPGHPSLLGISFKAVVEILVRNAIHHNPKIAAASVNALRKLASRKNAGNLVTNFARVAFRFTEKPGPTYDSDYFSSEEFTRLLRVYVELLKCWLHQFSNDSVPNTVQDNGQEGEMMNSDVLNDLYQINHKAPDLTNLEPPSTKLKPYEELEWKTIITVIEEVEGNGLFFLCSHDSRIRLFAISILKVVEQFDQSIYNNTDKKEITPTTSNSSPAKGHSRNSSKYAADEGTRLVHVLEDLDFMELIKPFKKELSVPERTRLTKLKSKKGILLKFAASDYGIDSTIWFRILPKLLDIFFERCPMPVAMCRSIVCVRLVQMHELVVDFSDSYKNYTSSIFGRSTTSTPPEVLVNQWKLYLIFACCSLTSTNEQKISFPTQPTHGHKKSLTMYIQHQKITSAKSVFRMVLPLLRSLQPMIREAVIAGLSCININILKTLAENLPDSLNDWEVNQKKRDPIEDRVRIEIVHILSSITSRFRSNSVLYSDDRTLANLVSIIKNVKAFLSVPFIQTLPEFQRLRCHFSLLLENLFVGLREKLDLGRWLPFEARIGCFNFLKEWCGYGDSKDVLEERYAIMIQKAQQLKETATAAAILELEKKALQNAALSCMATICSGAMKQSFTVPGKTAVISFDIRSVMDWVHEIIDCENERVQEIGKIALRNILALNINNEEIYQEVLRQCYNSKNSLKVREIYYTNTVVAFLKFRKIDSMPYDIFCLSTFLVGTDNFEIRFAAIKCIKFIETQFLKTSTTDYFTESVCCSTMVVYKKVLFEISVKLASLHSKDAFTFISYLTKYFNLVDNSTRRDILACLLPWVQTVELKYESDLEEVKEGSTETVAPLLPSKARREIDTASLMVLNNLFENTVKFSQKISNEVEALWVALGTNPSNFDIIIEYIMRNCLERRNSSFVSYSRQIIAYLVFSKPDSSYIIDKLISNLQPRAMVPQQTNHVSPKLTDDVQGFPYTANLSGLLSYNGKDSAFSLGQLSMVFLVDLFRSNNEMIVQHLPLLLHVCFSLLDHYFPVVQEQAASLLIHLVHSIAPESPKTARTIDTLRQKEHFKYLWVYDDLNNDKKGGITPKNMDLLVRNILEIFTPSVPTLQTDWCRVSLKWATSCAVRHIACRSFQLFRSLLSFLDQNMLKDMLHRLSNTIADESTDIQGFAMQILMTLNAITAELDSEKLIDFPQLFWSSVACLSTIHEHEFIETISTMSKFVSKIDLDAPDTISCLISTFPPKWEGKFEGLQQIVMVGLRSSIAWEPTIKFLDKLNRLNDSEIIGSGDYRLFIALIANFPRFLHALEQKTIPPEIEETCNLISKMATGCEKLALARILNSLAKNRFRSKKDFLVQTISTIRNSFFPEYEAQTLVLLLSFLSNKIPWVKLETLNILKHTFPLVDLQRDEFVGVGADLISPLLRLLLTEYAEPALEVIDEAVVISGSQLDKDILRMSLGNTSMKKEYEQTATLFGIPEESGWAIPMPAVTAASTRHNVHAVFETCVESAVVDEKHTDTFADEEIQFLMEDYYAPVTDRGDSVSVNIEEPAASLSNMWAALDDFDSFFTKDKDTEQRAQLASSLPLNGRNFAKKHLGYHNHSFSVDTKNSNSSDLTSPIDSVPHVYDKKALVILNQSLARTHSNSSFKSSLADTFGSPKSFTQDSPAAKRSYIPFRNNRVSKNKGDAFTTPKMSSGTPTFEQTSVGARAALKTSPPISMYQRPVSPLEPISPESANLEATTRLDHLLSGGRKRNRRN